MTLTVTEWEAARRDPVVFAEALLKVDLFEHQVAVIRSEARYRVLCWGRRAGKTTVFGVLALHTAFARPGSKILIVSAGDLSVKRTHREIAGMVTAAVGLAESVEDDQTHMLRLSNGSSIESVPQSIRAVRSAEADLLILDEAGFIDQAVFEAAEPIVGTRPGARVLIASTPWGGSGHFFHDLFRQGMDRPDAEVWASHMPSTASPLINAEWLESVRERSSSDYFAREYLAEWTGQSGAYFGEDELMANVADYHVPSLEKIRDASWVEGQGFGRVLPALGGIDWALRVDANALVCLSPLQDHDLNAERLGRGLRPMFISHLAARSQWPWHAFTEHIAEVAGTFDLKMLASEVNGVGDAATAMLREALKRRRLVTAVGEVWTDQRRKMAGFGRLKAMLQRGVLVLPRDPELLRELRSLEFEQTSSGGLRISVPENRGHDDRAMALLQAASCLGEPESWRAPADPWVDLADRNVAEALEQKRGYALAREEWVATAAGVQIPTYPLPDPAVRTYGWFRWPAGVETSEAW